MANESATGMVSGVFGSRQQAEAVIEDLRRLGLSDKDLGLVVPDPERHHLVQARETGREVAGSVSKGIAAGATLGSLAGLAVMAAVLPGAGVVGLAGLLIGAEVGAALGAILGGYGGLIVRVGSGTGDESRCEIRLGSGDILVVVRSEEYAEEALRLMAFHGARCLSAQPPRVEEPAERDEGLPPGKAA
ncbi:MAG: hypothetical protein HYY04_03920 [Chloroflexi bacterium]|nr:hypothetical protein [Chloroflexota bacterium]